MSSDAHRGLEADCGRENFDAVVSVLLNEQARRVIEFFQNSGELVVSRDALADHLHDISETADDRDRVAIKLTHVTLPKLDDAGLIEYDHQRPSVKYRETPLSECASTLLTLREDAT